MPTNCPLHYDEPDACNDCRNRIDDKCWVYTLAPVQISDILTDTERVAILEAKDKTPLNITTVPLKDYQALQRRVLLLEEKLNTHIGKTAKVKSKYA